MVDPGRKWAFGPLRRILDENRLTPAAVLLTHGHIDHIWSAQKVADTYGCPVFIHPEDRHPAHRPDPRLRPPDRADRPGRAVPGARRSSTSTVTEPNWTSVTSASPSTHPGPHPGSVAFRVQPTGSDGVGSEGPCSPATPCSSSRLSSYIKTIGGIISIHKL